MQNKPKRDVIAKDERSKTDKNRERRLKKIVQKKKQKFQEEKDRRKAERDPRFRERLEKKQARENLKNSTNTKVLKTVCIHILQNILEILIHIILDMERRCRNPLT